MKKSRTLAPSKYLRKYGKAKISRPMITKEEVEAVLECAITDERYEELLEASRLYSLSNSDKHVNLAQDAEHRQDWEGAKKHWKNAALASIKHDTIHKTQRSDKLKVRGITMRKEEVEQIDELSNEKKAQYIKRSKQSRESHHIHADHYADRGASGKKGFFKHMDKASKRLKGIATAKASMKAEAVELSSSRKTKVNALLAKHQAKGLPTKPSKKYTREYTGDGLPLIAAVINQEETLNESRSDRRERPKHVDSNSKRLAGYPPKNKVTKQITNSKERAAKKEYIRKAMDESNANETINEWKKSTTTKHTCGGVSFGKKAPKGTCPRCDELHDGHAPVKWDHSKRDADIQRSKEIKAHDCKKSKCGPVCTFGDW